MLEPMTSEQLLRAAVLSAAWLLAACIGAWVLDLILRRLARRAQGESVLGAVRLPVTLMVLAGGVHEALTVWPWVPKASLAIERTVPAVMALLGVVAIARMLSVAMTWLAQRRDEEQAAVVFLLRRIAVGAVWAVGAVIVLDHLGYHVGPLLASLGVAGIAIAVGLQDTVAGLFGGLYLILDRPFVVGEFIRLEGGQEGFVSHIGWRSTRLETTDGRRLIVPNVTLAKAITVVAQPPVGTLTVTVTGKAEFATDVAALEKACLDAGGRAFGVVGLNAGIEFRVTAPATSAEAIPDAELELRMALLEHVAAAGIKLV